MEGGAPASGTQQRIACFLPSFSVGGAELFMIRLANGFAERGYQVDLVLASRRGGSAGQIHARARIVHLEASGSLAAFWPLVSYIRKERPAVMLSSHVHTNIVAIVAARLFLSGTRAYARESTTPSVNDALLVKGKSRFVAQMRRWIYPLATKVIAPSEGVADDVAAYLRVRREKIEVINNGVDCDSIGVRASEAAEHPFFRTGEPVIVSVGRLCVEKDFSTLISAFALAASEIPARLIILGEGPSRVELEDLIGKLGIAGRVSLPGFVDNPAKYVQRAALFALSSICEGFPNALLEAMAVGTRVIATDCRSGPREMLMDGKWGGLVRIGDVDDMRAHIVDALRGRWPPMPRALLGKKFGLERAVDGYLEAFELAGSVASSAGT
jgi:glycosyltransferase involved in cell wall biosynthesis